MFAILVLAPCLSSAFNPFGLLRESLPNIKVDIQTTNVRLNKLSLLARDAAKEEEGSQTLHIIDFLTQRLTATAEEANDCKAKMSERMRRYPMTWDEAEAVCDALQEQFGFDDAELREVVLKHPAVLDVSLEDEGGSVLQAVQEMLKMQDAEVKQLVLRQPSLLTYITPGEQLRALHVFRRRCGLDGSQFKQEILKDPNFLRVCTSFVPQKAPDGKNGLYSLVPLRSQLELTPSRTRQLLVRHPLILKRTKVELNETLGNLSARLKYSIPEMRQLVFRCPQLLTDSLGNNTESLLNALLSTNWSSSPFLDALNKTLGFNDTELKKMVSTHPQVLRYSVKDRIIPFWRLFERTLGFSAAEFKRIMQLQPWILGYNITEDDVVESVKFLKAAYKLNDTELHKLVLRQPSVLRRTTSNTSSYFHNFLTEHVGLSEAEVKQVIRRRPSFRSKSATTLLLKFRALQKHANFSAEEMKKIIKKCPDILFCDIEHNVLPSLQLLQNRFELNDKEVRRLLLFVPRVAIYDAQNHVLPQFERLKARLELSEEEVKKVLLRSSASILITGSMENNLLPSLDMLQQRLLLSQAELRKLFLKNPGILSYNIEGTVLPFIKDFRDRLELSEEETRKIVLACPKILNSRLDSNIIPKLEGLKERLGLTALQLVKVMLKAPSIVTLTLNSLFSKIGALQEALELSEEEIRKLLYTAPSLLTRSFEDSILPSLIILQERLGINTAELKKLVRLAPNVLTYSMEDNLLPKFDWMQDNLGLSNEELRERVFIQPAIMGFSLENRYKPRLKACLKMGVAPIQVLTKSCFTDYKFAVSIGMPRTGMVEFKTSPGRKLVAVGGTKKKKKILVTFHKPDALEKELNLVEAKAEVDDHDELELRKREMQRLRRKYDQEAVVTGKTEIANVPIVQTVLRQ